MTASVLFTRAERERAAALDARLTRLGYLQRRHLPWATPRPPRPAGWTEVEAKPADVEASPEAPGRLIHRTFPMDGWKIS